MYLYAPKNSDDQIRIPADLYLVPVEVQQSENTSSLHVLVYEDEDSDNYLTNGWISLSSDNFVVDNY